MDDLQTAALFANMSTQTAKIVASNGQLMETVWTSVQVLGGFLLALIVPVTWKG